MLFSVDYIDRQTTELKTSELLVIVFNKMQIFVYFKTIYNAADA